MATDTFIFAHYLQNLQYLRGHEGEVHVGGRSAGGEVGAGGEVRRGEARGKARAMDVVLGLLLLLSSLLLLLDS